MNIAYEVFLWLAVAVWRDKSPEFVHKKNDAERVRLDEASRRARARIRAENPNDDLAEWRAVDPELTNLKREYQMLQDATDAAFATWRSLSDASESVLRARGLDGRYPATEVDAWLMTHLRPSGAVMTWCHDCRALVIVCDRLQERCPAGHYIITKWRVFADFREPSGPIDHPDPETAS